MHIFNVKTDNRTQLIDITSNIRKYVSDSGIRSGICMVFSPHTTGGITLNENADPDVIVDILKEINKIVPFDDQYSHIEGNSAAHIKSSMFGFSEQLIIEDGRLILGTWQSIYFCEFDGPRTRKVYVKIIGE